MESGGAQDPAVKETLTARPVSLLDCFHGQSQSGRVENILVLTLGNPDASVDMVALTIADAKRLLHGITVALGRENLPYGPANEEKIIKRWVVPHSVGRAELNVEGEEEEYLSELKTAMPELAEYMASQLTSLRRTLSKRGKSTAAPETVVKRVMRFVLVAVATARTGT